MSTKLRFHVINITAIWLGMLVEKSTCPNGKADHPRDLGEPIHRPVQNLPGGFFLLPTPQVLQPPPPLSPIQGPSWSPLQLGPVPGPSRSPSASSPIAGPSWAGSPPRSGILPMNRPGSPLGAGRFRISPSSSPPTLDSVVFGQPVPPPRLSHFPDLSGPPPQLSHFLGPSGSLPQLSHFPGPSWSSSASALQATVAGPSRPTRYRTPRPQSLQSILRMMRPRPGEPGSPENPGNILPSPSQRWLAAAFYGGLFPAQRMKAMNQQCFQRSICEEGTCCLHYGRNRKRCKPLSKHGQPCSPSALTTVYYGACPCGPLEGTCIDGICL
ncbi:uncharacterized protein LOC142765411 isoform X2 [Rhipicephalus microplus]|uniref:uncharacterized protein LOC142765411 isoform X2 n=1 Tax=Rhipicephalus microplus TaxID=6941 RepID=UPI003F6D8C34